MARGRMLNKTISLDEKVAALSDDTARLLFTWMIAHLDVEGRMYGDARLFLSIVAPRRNISLRKVEKYLTEFENFGLILRYNINGNTYLFSPNFEKHQTGLRKDKEAKSQIPAPPSQMPAQSPDLLPTKDGVKTELLPTNGQPPLLPLPPHPYPPLPPHEAKKKSKFKRKEVEGATSTFETYKDKLRLKFPEFDINEEWEKCQIWYRDNKKTIKSPSLALMNWMKIAQERKDNHEREGKSNDTRKGRGNTEKDGDTWQADIDARRRASVERIA